MSVILIIEQDESYADRIVETLRQEGWAAKKLSDSNAAVEAARLHQPTLVIASASQPEGTSLLRSFSRQEGGPGSVALIPVGVANRVTAADFQADEILAKPFSDEDLKRIVRRCLASTPPAASEAPKVARKNKQLTSADIFGDVLAEVEAEALRTRTKRSRAKTAAEELDRKLEETLSGVLPIGGRFRRPEETPAHSSPPEAKAPVAPPAAPAWSQAPKGSGKARSEVPTETEIDDLLDKTLSSLELPQRHRKSAARPSPRQPITPPAEEKPTLPPEQPTPVEVEPQPASVSSTVHPSQTNSAPEATPGFPIQGNHPDKGPPSPPTVPGRTPPSQSGTTESHSGDPHFSAPLHSRELAPPDLDLEPVEPPLKIESPGNEDLWKGIEPPPDLFPQSFDSLPSTEEPPPEEILEPLGEFSAYAAPPNPFDFEPTSAAGNEGSFSFTESFVPPSHEPPADTADRLAPDQAESFSFTDTFIPPDPMAREAGESGALHSSEHEASFPSYEARAAGSRSFLDDSHVAAPTPVIQPEPSRASTNSDAGTAKDEGQIFGDYTLLDRVATGGMAEVWRARRRGVEGFQKTVAIKKILGHLTDSPDFINMFIDEAKLAAQLNHNNIIQIYDLGKAGEDFFIAMEYVDGKDLRSILTTGKELARPLPVGLALLIVASLARALDYAHRRRDFEDRPLGLVHRDVSPQNVLISYEGEIKLCDFGIVKAVSKASTTQMGALKGKLQYMSPEQAWGKKVDGRSDIFSVGSVLFEVLTGTKLFTGDNEISVLDAVRECRIRSPLEIVPDLPVAVDDIVRKALAKAPEDRYQTAGDLEADLKSLLDTLRPTPSPSDLATYLSSIFSEQPLQFSSYEVGEESQEPSAPSSTVESSKFPPRADEQTPSSSRLKKVLVAFLLSILLGGLGFAIWKLAGPQSANPPTPETSSAPSTSESPLAVEEPNADSPLTSAESEDAEASATDTPPEALAGAENPQGGTEANLGLEARDEDGPDGNLDLEQMVEQGLAEQEQLLQKRLEEQYEEKRRRLQEEISRTQQSFQESPEATETSGEPPPDGNR